MKIGDTCYVLVDDVSPTVVKFIDVELDLPTQSMVFVFESIERTLPRITFRFGEKALFRRIYATADDTWVDRLPF